MSTRRLVSGSGGHPAHQQADLLGDDIVYGARGGERAQMDDGDAVAKREDLVEVL